MLLEAQMPRSWGKEMFTAGHHDLVLEEAVLAIGEPDKEHQLFWRRASERPKKAGHLLRSHSTKRSRI